jgi:hypothetical protein
VKCWYMFCCEIKSEKLRKFLRAERVGSNCDGSEMRASKFLICFINQYLVMLAHTPHRMSLVVCLEHDVYNAVAKVEQLEINLQLA